MLATLKGAGLLSTRSGIELNTASSPDEVARVDEEEERKFQAELKHKEETKKMEAKFANNNTTTITNKQE